MNHAKRSTVDGGGEMKRATSGAASIASNPGASFCCNSRNAQCSPVSTGTASRQQTGGAAGDTDSVVGVATGGWNNRLCVFMGVLSGGVSAARTRQYRSE